MSSQEIKNREAMGIIDPSKLELMDSLYEKVGQYTQEVKDDYENILYDIAHDILELAQEEGKSDELKATILDCFHRAKIDNIGDHITKCEGCGDWKQDGTLVEDADGDLICKDCKESATITRDRHSEYEGSR